VKLNATELAEFSGMPTATEADVVAAATAISTQGGGGARNVIATRGPDGAVLVGEGGIAHARASVHPGRIISSVGSGDALLAGFLQEITRTGDWLSALKSGVAVATANAVNREAGLIEPADLEEFLASATAEPIAIRK
jgi:fructose-1-phosphate kinase PfkB-like protein